MCEDSVRHRPGAARAVVGAISEAAGLMSPCPRFDSPAATAVPRYGTRVEYPPGTFAAVGSGGQQRFESDDRHAVLSIYALENENDGTPASYLRKNPRQQILRFERVTRFFFAISMERDGTVYYSRCSFSHSAGGSIHCFDLVNPQEEKRAWDPVVARMSLSLRPLER